MFYDADGRMIRKIDAVGTEEKFFYDPLNRMIESIDVLGNRRFFAYDKLGNVITERFFETRAGHFWLLFRSERTYDELGRLVKSSVNEFESPVEVIGVDVKNAFVQHGPGELRTTLYFYDKNGHMTKKITPRGQETTMEYDKVGRLVMRIDANGNKIKYRYDKHGNLVRYDIEAIVP